MHSGQLVQPNLTSISSLVLPLNAHMHKHGLCRRVVSVTFVYYVETAKDSAIVVIECE